MAGSGTAHLRSPSDTLLRAENLVVEFPVGKTGMKVHAVSDVSIDVKEGETLGLVGESGCGKSTTGKAIMQLPRPTSGEVLFSGRDLTELNGQDLRRVRPDMQMIFQDPISSLNPRRRVRDIIAEPLRIWAAEQNPPASQTLLASRLILLNALVRYGAFAVLFVLWLLFDAVRVIMAMQGDAPRFYIDFLRADGLFIAISAFLWGSLLLWLHNAVKERSPKARLGAMIETPVAVAVAVLLLVAGGFGAAQVVALAGAALSVLSLLLLITPAATQDFGAMKDLRAEHEQVVRRTLEDVGIDPDAAMDRRPHEFSGGQCQRLSIARALVLNPKLIVCDEPVSALDVSVQAQILNLLEDMKVRYGLTLVFIAHDLAVVKNISDRVAVMYLGKLCEVATPEDLYNKPAHPYTAALLSSIPVPDPAYRPSEDATLGGEIPSPLAPPSGCRFRTRCPRAQDMCAQVEPKMRQIGLGHYVACHFPLEVTEKQRPASTRAKS